jgi:4-amino-4-deoxy-L-arabinose transferase-like glycosyltransferase
VLLQSARRWLVKRDALDRLLLIWFVVVFVLFSLVRTKFDWYLLPLYVPLVMMLARGCSEFLHQEKDRLLVWATVASFFAGAYVLPLGLAHEGFLWRLTPYAYLPSSFIDTVSGRTVVAAAVTALVVAATLLLKTQTIIKPTRVVGMAVIVYLLAIAGGWQYSYLKHLPATAPLKDMSAKLSALKAKDVDVVGINLVTQPAGDYYLRSVSGLTVHELKQADDVSHSLILTDTNSPQYDSVRGMGSAILERDHFVLLERPVMAQ